MHFPYLQQINAIYYFRTRIPSDLLEWFDNHEIKRSLRTRNYQFAKSQAVALTYKAEQLFALIRSGMLGTESIPEYIQKHFPQNKGKPKEARKSFDLGDVIKAYIHEHVTLKKWTEKTRLENESILNLFVRLMGTQDVRRTSRPVMIALVEKLKRVPAHLNKKPEYKGKSIEELLRMPDLQTLETRTVNKYLSRISSLFIWGVRQGYLYKNPAEGLSIAELVREDEEREAYSREDISCLLNCLAGIPPDKPERYWIPIVALYTGMRLDEICQLYTNDVIEIDGVWCIAINCNGDKKLKTVASRRNIPIHPELVRLGFLEYHGMVQQRGDERLWMNLIKGRDGYSHLLGKWYQRHNRKHITANPKRCFHSFRHTVADTLKQQGCNEAVIAEILGHRNESITMGRYGKRYHPKILLDALCQLNFGLNP
ncbi:MAG: site-specific integrase [Deltaproteobacteria bacterium]|nr:site-specific integrase [Deltaproteobacteria bacterium]